MSSDDIVAGSDEDVFRGTLQTLTVYLMDTMRQRSVSSSISDSTDRGIGGSGLRRRASSITSSGLPPGGSAGYWQHKGYTKVASLDHLDWDIISRSAAYHVEANLPELEVISPSGLFVRVSPFVFSRIDSPSSLHSRSTSYQIRLLRAH